MGLVACATMRERERERERERKRHLGEIQVYFVCWIAQCWNKMLHPSNPCKNRELQCSLGSSMVRNPNHIQFPQTRSDHQ